MKITPNENYDQIREDMHENIADTFKENTEHEAVTGWILLVETRDSDGDRVFHAVSADIFGDRDLAPWTARGWLDEASDGVYEFFVPVTEEPEEGDGWSLDD